MVFGIFKQGMDVTTFKQSIFLSANALTVYQNSDDFCFTPSGFEGPDRISPPKDISSNPAPPAIVSSLGRLLGSALT